MKADPNAPAYPVSSDVNPEGFQSGMTIRQKYAMAAMQGVIAADTDDLLPHSEIAKMAFESADAMIAFENGEVNGE